ncbi:complexin, partial [Nilaparvata lugens]|uniref:complexin n=1 Tax=Nilaparvata lugens TaxID=108931 RepID=UPI00193E1645
LKCIFRCLQYKIVKKEEIQEPVPEEPDNPLMRKKKTPEELAREAEEADQDEFTKLKNTIETQVNELKTQIESKCLLQ